MKLGAFRGNSLHAPENSLAALISGYVSGADLLQFELQQTSDGQLVLAAENNLERVTGEAVECQGRTLEQLAELDWSETFRPRDSEGFVYYTAAARRLRPVTLREALDKLPEAAEFLIRVDADSPAETRLRLLAAAETVREFGVEGRTVFYSADAGALEGAGSSRTAQFIPSEASPVDDGARGVAVPVSAVWGAGALTAFGAHLKQQALSGRFPDGVFLLPDTPTGALEADRFDALAAEGFVYATVTPSALDLDHATRRAVTLVETSFAGTEIDRTRFAFGYAKANRFGQVFQDDGVHIKIDPYTGELPGPSPDPAENRLRHLEARVIDAQRDWPYYSGGGVGFLQGIRGDFSARVSYTVVNVAQATTLEMAVVNVDPGAHVEHRPTSFREKDSFYDPHGAPPFAGVEHDEDDGFRINYNLGTEYDNNQYGRPVGDGATPRGAELRLDRRGVHFAAYYRHPVDQAGNSLPPRDWVCVGVARNDSLNRVVYVRCAGKRWRQERTDDPSQHFPILANEFRFFDLGIERYLD